MSEGTKLSDNLSVIRYENGVIEFWENAGSDEEGVFRLNGTESEELVKWIKSLP